jgi:hypothetical protein
MSTETITPPLSMIWRFTCAWVSSGFPSAAMLSVASASSISRQQQQQQQQHALASNHHSANKILCVAASTTVRKAAFLHFVS